MAAEKPTRSKAPSEESRAPRDEPLRAEEEALSTEIRQETDALLTVAENLARASQSFSRQQQELESVRSMQLEMQKVLSQIVQSIGNTGAAASRELPATREAESIPASQGQRAMPAARHEVMVSEGRECECECVHPGCCCFDIYFDKVRGIQPQGLLEPADMGDTTLPLPTINELEVRLFISLDNTNIGLLLPGLSTTFGIRVPSMLAGGGPGLWMPINQVVGRVCLKRGTTRTVMLRCWGSEIDEGAERPIGFKDEHGEATGSITLDCCTSMIYPPVPIDLSFDQGGIGGGQPGAISMAFYAKRVCC